MVMQNDLGIGDGDLKEAIEIPGAGLMDVTGIQRGHGDGRTAGINGDQARGTDHLDVEQLLQGHIVDVVGGLAGGATVRGIDGEFWGGERVGGRRFLRGFLGVGGDCERQEGNGANAVLNCAAGRRGNKVN
jgi:hypothetical protein